MDKENSKREVQKLIEKYDNVVKENRVNIYNEEMTKKDFILPLFRALGWNTEDSTEVTAEEKISKKRVDYGFRINGIPKFMLETKKLKENIMNTKFVEQAIDYSWNKGCTWAVLTNFENVTIFNAEWKVEKSLWYNKYKTIESKELLQRFDELWLLSRESFEQNLIDKEAEKVGKKVKRVSIDKQLLYDFTRFRELLSKNIIKLNPKKSLSELELDESVQRILDRLIFIRNCEDRELEPRTLISNYREWSSRGKGQLIKSLRDTFFIFNKEYNSKIFAEHLCDDLDIDNDVLQEIIEGLYYTKDKSISYDFSAIDADILGTVYEQYLSHILKKTEKITTLTENHIHKKEQGIYYTPTYVVDYIVRNTLGELLKDKTVNVEKIRVLDPACGSGSFLIKAYDILNEYQSKNDATYHQAELDFKTDTIFTKKMKILQNNIFGVDLDKQAVEIAQLNLLLKIAEKKKRLPLLEQNIKLGNSLIEDKNIVGELAFNWKLEYKQIMDEGGFDIVIGNPPYFNIKSDDILKNSRDYELLSQGVVNSASLFLKKGLDLLKKNGYLGFIIPKSFLIVDSWKPIRDIVLGNSLISVRDVSIAFKEVGLEQVIIIVRKREPIDNKVSIWKEDKEINTIPQQFFKKREVILTSLDQEKLMIVEKIEKDSLNLGQFADMPRGITVKSSEYFSEPSIERIHVLGGTNVERYGIKIGGKRKPNRYLDKDDPRIQQRKDAFPKERIIYQNIASSVPKIVASLEPNGLPTDDTLNNLIIHDTSTNNKYVMAILNSKLVTFYLRYALINCSLLTVHLDKPYLGKISIKRISIEKQRPIIDLVERMLSLNTRLGEIGVKLTDERAKIEAEIKEIDTEIDDLVYTIYGITEDEKEIIEENLK